MNTKYYLRKHIVEIVSKAEDRSLLEFSCLPQPCFSYSRARYSETWKGQFSEGRLGDPAVSTALSVNGNESKKVNTEGN